MTSIEKAFVQGMADEFEKLGAASILAKLYRSAKAHPFISGLIAGHLASKAGRGLKNIVRGTRE